MNYPPDIALAGVALVFALGSVWLLWAGCRWAKDRADTELGDVIR